MPVHSVLCVGMCFVKSANIDVWFENFEACDTFH